jgi:hypothetical protein
MARLDYSMVGSILWAMTIADLDAKKEPVLQRGDIGSEIQQKHLNIINTLLKNSTFLSELRAAQSAYKKIVDLGNNTAGTWTGTDCYLEKGQINKVANLESETRVLEHLVAKTVEDQLRHLFPVDSNPDDQ